MIRRQEADIAAWAFGSVVLNGFGSLCVYMGGCAG